MNATPTPGSRVIAWVNRIACRIGSHDWEVLEAKIDHNVETALCHCTRPGCGHEEIFTTALTTDTWQHH